MSAPEPNRIHTLPVQVSYHLPSSSQIFTTLLPTLQQVYVYPAAPSSSSSSSSSSSKHTEESWGSIYLKTVVQGVILSSPEYLPSPTDSTTDLSLYTFDPRETYLRRSRVNIHPPHLRRSAASSPLLASPDISNSTQGGEVWTGKGLVSKALNEPGLGKNLITGRLVRRLEFSIGEEGVDPLTALMQAKEEGGWGIEVSLGLRNGQSGQTFGLGQQTLVGSGSGSRSTSPMPTPIASTSSAPPPMPARHSYPVVPQRPRPTIPSARTTSYLPPSTDARTSSTPARPVPTTTRKATVTKKRPTPPPRHLATVDQNSRRAPTKTSAGLPLDIPRHVYDNPDLLTKEQAERLIASPFFLDKLSEMTGHPLVPKVKREREDDVQQSNKKAKGKHEKEPTVCYNCGRINNLVWRHMVLDDGSTTVSICNACGLYRNRHGIMRPPSMWDGVDDEIKPSRLVSMPSSDIDLPAQRLDSGFKRTMSTVVEQDAKRIASRKPVASRTMPMTSPPRGSKSVTKTVRHSSSRIQQQPAASSPGPFTNHSSAPQHRQQSQQSFVFNPDDSPNTTLNKIIGASMPMQSLDLPLSDDGREKAQMPWTNDNNTSNNKNNNVYYNNTERFEMSAGPHGATSLKSPSPPPKFTRTSSTASKRYHNHNHQPSGGTGTGTDEDDILSQLFNRTSSVGPLGSSPAPFDFSQLPPSSPPASNGPSSDIDLELGHSAMLLSSPDISPASSHCTNPRKISPEKKSTLNQSFTPDDINVEEKKIEVEMPPSYDYDIEELWSKLQNQYDQSHPLNNGSGSGMESSGQIAEGLLTSGGEDDFLALFNSLTNDNAH